ncbi:hypothetical protein CHLRE_06g301550v5 [Chlamydomonas reinhardtii]|uniref:Major facilitator superfamily (MFS) profile domain-containing protein n=1 Tax=Chlamydomonas reinhardtii TaxID=3055 RepID=A0A2K3DR32_CHLRE|nr:uncharacterized protein CHLRE_06g301550v5 [Chlamydomonas reinhardtii]PNW82967.1 hypothetical protein CHLRE_06g301550v5 [Chlamydomonas reinhardtii]
MTTALPKWFTPLRLLGIFCLTNLVVYLDRGLIASNGVNGTPRTEADPDGSGIQGEFDLNYVEDGLLPALFMVGLLISSPIFAETVKHYSAFRLLGIGMAVWSASVVACGIAPNFGLLLTARAFVGVGEASFVALAAPFIDDFAPAAQKARWFAAFYLCIPVGFALGYIVGGAVTAVASWRWAFVGEGLVMVPFTLFALTAQPLQLRGSKPAGAPHHRHHRGATGWQHWRALLREFGGDVAIVLRQRVWLAVCGAYTAYVAVLGVYAYWGPQAGAALFFPRHEGDTGPRSSTADLTFGGVTVLTGVVGSVAGGLALDKMGSTLRNANLLCAFANLVGFVFLLLAFTTSQTFAAFMGLFAVGQLIIFLLQAPVAAIGMWCVPPELRPLGASLMTVSIHLLGDVPSPPLVGLLQQRLAAGKSPADAAEQWRISLSVVSLLLLVSGSLFLLGAWLSVPGTDWRGKAPANQEQGSEEGDGVGGEEGLGGVAAEGGPDVRPLLLEEGGAGRQRSSDEPLISDK